MTTIVLADDHNVVRRGIKALLEAEADIKGGRPRGPCLAPVNLTALPIRLVRT